MKLGKASLLIGLVSKVAYTLSSIAMLTKSVGRKAYDKLNYKAIYNVTVVDLSSGMIIIDNARKSIRDINEIASALKDANVRITLERSN